MPRHAQAREMPVSAVKELRKLCEESGRLASDVRTGLYAENLSKLADRANGLEERFHGAIIAAADARILTKIISDLQLMERMEADWENAPIDDFAKYKSHHRVYREHTAIAEAIAARSSTRARNMMVRHIHNARRHDLASLAAHKRGASALQKLKR